MAAAAVTPQPGSLVEVYYGSGAGSDYSEEAMGEVNMTPAHPRYTVYKITDATKRLMIDSTVPVFQKQTGGVGEFATLTPSEIWYGAGHIVLSAVIGSTDVVRCLSGKYVTPTRIFACFNREYEQTLEMADKTCYGDTARRKAPTIKDWNAMLDVLYAGVQATAVSSGGEDHSHIRCYHVLGGIAGNGPTFDFQDTAGAAIVITVTDDDVVVELATVAGNPVSTAKEVVAALNADPDVVALDLVFMVEDGETGAAVVADSGPYTLSGGVAAIEFSSLEETLMVFKFFTDLTYDVHDTGFGYIRSIVYSGSPDALVVAKMTVDGAEHPMRRCIGV